MAEYSFPVVEEPLSDAQWGQVAEGFGSGILARGSEPYGINAFDNAMNTANIGGRSTLAGDGRAVVSGFFHRYDADLTISIPAVSTSTTYYIGLTYDPTRHAAPGGPVSLTVTTTRPDGDGKVYLPVYRITRQANQLLSDATVVDERAFVAPSLTVKGSDALPPADSVLTYTVVVDWETGQQWQMQLDRTWKPIGARVERLRSPGAWNVTGSCVAMPLMDGRTQYTMDIHMERSAADATTQGTTFVSRGYVLPDSLRSSRGVVYVTGMIGLHPGVIAINTEDGAIETRLYEGTYELRQGSRITGSAIWVA